MARKERLSDISPFKNVITVVGISVVAAACRQEGQVASPPSETPEVPPSPTLEMLTPTSTIEIEIAPTPTVAIELIGVGGETELTEAELGLAETLERDYTTAARRKALGGTIFITRGDEEGEIGAYFEDLEGGFWQLARERAAKVLEQVPDYKETTPIWNPDTVRFEYSLAGRIFAWQPEERQLVDEQGRLVARREAEAWWYRVFADDKDYQVMGESWNLSQPQVEGDFIAEVEMSVGKDATILLGNPDSRNFYAIQFHDWGGFQVDRVTPNSWGDVNDPQGLSISPGEPFQARVMRLGDEINLAVNGREIYSFPDTLDADTEVGFLGSGSPAQISRVELWSTEEPPAVVVEPTPVAQPTPTREPQPIPEPAAEVCDVTGLCHERTEKRIGIITLSDGTEYHLPLGRFTHYTGDPNNRFQGTWVLSGRVAEIVDYEEGIILFEVRDGEKIKIDILFEHERFYARLQTGQLGVPWYVAMPEIVPRLGRDIQPGDYIELTPASLDPPFLPSNALSEDENYERFMTAAAQGARIVSAKLELWQ